MHRTKRDAERVCTELVAEADRGGFGDTAASTLAELVECWLVHLKPNVSPATLAAYENYMRKWILPALGPKKLDRIRPVDLDLFYASLRPHLAGASVRKVHTILHSALGQATRWQLIGTDPAAAATPPRFDKPAINPPTPEEVGRLLAAAAATKSSACSSASPPSPAPGGASSAASAGPTTTPPPASSSCAAPSSRARTASR